jgi:hypothetical protein
MSAPLRRTLDRERLARVLGMLGSEHDGEALAAARQAERLRATAGVTWHDIVAPSATPAVLGWPGSITEAIEACIGCPAALTTWEKKFLAGIARRREDRLSAKQLAVLARLVRAVMAARAAA